MSNLNEMESDSDCEAGLGHNFITFGLVTWPFLITCRTTNRNFDVAITHVGYMTIHNTQCFSGTDISKLSKKPWS